MADMDLVNEDGGFDVDRLRGGVNPEEKLPQASPQGQDGEAPDTGASMTPSPQADAKAKDQAVRVSEQVAAGGCKAPDAKTDRA